MFAATTTPITDQQIQYVLSSDAITANYVNFIQTLMSQYNNDMPAIMQRCKPILREMYLSDDCSAAYTTEEEVDAEVCLICNDFEDLFNQILAEAKLGKSAVEIAVLINEDDAKNAEIEHILDDHASLFQVGDETNYASILIENIETQFGALMFSTSPTLDAVPHEELELLDDGNPTAWPTNFNLSW